MSKGLSRLIGASSGPTHHDLRRYFREVCVRSSTVRETLKDRTKEPSVESLVRQVDDFCELHRFSRDELRAMMDQKLSDDRRLSMLCDAFTSWYYDVKAPKVVNMEQPWGWYPRARQLRRNVIFHAGPTNSGKTHSALESLMSAKSGVYCAPLKALASQVWSKINERVNCDLIIGDERIFTGYAEHVSCTMEMTPVDEIVQVGVIDEVQLIADKDRGWAWTRALLGLPARELHLCGEFRTLGLIKNLLYATRELPRLTIKTHERLVPLRIEDTYLGALRDLERGDCIVVFSRKAVFDVKQQIERTVPNVRVNIIYGGLPFDVRQAQCDDFNSGVASGHFHVLVSTDAIAYGLNMNIRRVIFSTLEKFDGKAKAPLSDSHVLQIAGRAGRYGLEFSNVGYVTCRKQQDLDVVRKAFAVTLQPIERAGLLPTADILQVFAAVRQDLTSFHALLEEFTRVSSTSKLFFHCDISRSLLPMAKNLEDVDMKLIDKIVFCFVPLSDSQPHSYALVRTWAVAHAAQSKVGMGPELSVTPLPTNDLRRLEWMYRMLEAYSWLAWRFQATFTDMDEAKKRKGGVVAAITKSVRSDRAARDMSSTVPRVHPTRELHEMCESDIRKLMRADKDSN
eukprot:PhM_4_TR17959/c0_g1_i1/m.8005/K17675/SUPV3L1, SUV3; ATP-dependent RNA helicase SUPV3L1/SUV3